MRIVTTSTGKATGTSVVSKVAFTVLGLLSLPALVHASLVQNGNFATWTSGAPNGWTLTHATTGSDFAENAGYQAQSQFFTAPPLGGNYAGFGSTASPTTFAGNYDEISQTIATTAGDKYDITFYLTAAASSYFRAYFGSDKLLEIDNSSVSGWKEYTFDVTASSSSTTLAFYGNNQLSWIGLGDIDVEDMGSLAPTPVPEPSTIMAAGLLLIPLGVSSIRILRRKMAANI